MAFNRSQPILIAGLLPLLVFTWFTRDYIGQIDFWLLWLVAMTLVGLPLVFAEIGLAHRSGTSPLVGLPKLTREADVSTVWRGFGWLTIVLLMAVVGHLLASSGEVVQPLVNGMAMPALLAILALLVIGLSFAKHLAGWLAFGFAVAALLVNVIHAGIVSWQVTNTSLTEWAAAVVLALVCVGAGTGLFWHARTHQMLTADTTTEADERLSASRYVLPVWSCQLVGGALIAMTLSPNSSLAAMLNAVAMVAGAAYLLHILTHQVSLRWQQQSFNFLVLVILAVLCLALAMVPTGWLNQLIIVISLIAAVWLAVFAGWQMKISHLRKSLNFSSEGLYNLWRIAVRILVPLAVLLAIVGWVLGLAR